MNKGNSVSKAKIVNVVVSGTSTTDQRRPTAAILRKELRRAGISGPEADRLAKEAAAMAHTKMETRRLRVLLVTRFDRWEVDEVVTGLSAIGVDVVRALSWEDEGQIRDVDAIACMHEKCGHSEFYAWQGRAKKAGVRVIRLPRSAQGWPAAVRAAGLTLP